MVPVSKAGVLKHGRPSPYAGVKGQVAVKQDPSGQLL